MKNLIICSGIALALLANLNNTSLDDKKKVKTTQKSRYVIVDRNSFKTEFSNPFKLLLPKVAIALKLNNGNLRNYSTLKTSKLIVGDEPIELIAFSKISKTANQLIAEDNAITENNISNEIQALDFDVINNNTIGYEFVEFINISKSEKTADQFIASDNAITASNFSNETQPLDFDLINSIIYGYEFVESVKISKKEKSANELIAGDNAITDNNISNEIQALDFRIINKISKS